MQRNTLLGGLALLAAGGLIGAGAMISSSAMADTPASPPADQVTMINVGVDGDAVKCTFDGADAAGMLPALPATPVDDLPIPASGSGVINVSGDAGSGVIAVSGAQSVDGTSIEIDPKNPPVGIEVSSGSVTAGGPVAVSDLPGDLKVLSADDARDGTPEECAAMKAGTSSAPSGDVQTIIGQTVGRSGGSDAGTPAKP